MQICLVGRGVIAAGALLTGSYQGIRLLYQKKLEVLSGLSAESNTSGTQPPSTFEQFEGRPSVDTQIQIQSIQCVVIHFSVQRIVLRLDFLACTQEAARHFSLG